jgi:chromosome segregation ATPase
MTAQIEQLQAKLDQTKAQRAELAKQREALKGKRGQVRAERAKLVQQRATTVRKLSELRRDRAKLEDKLHDAVDARKDLREAQAGMQDALKDLADTQQKLVVLREAVPGAFSEAEATYLSEIDELAPTLERTFSQTLNIGFRSIYFSTLATGVLGALLLLIYPRRKRPTEATVTTSDPEA